jgi:hypothetical protein
MTITRADGSARTVPLVLRIDTAIKVECLRRGDASPARRGRSGGEPHTVLVAHRETSCPLALP